LLPKLAGSRDRAASGCRGMRMPPGLGLWLCSSRINCVAECYNHLVMGGMQKAQSATHARVKSSHCIEDNIDTGSR
jgi:hypothetical protein